MTDYLVNEPPAKRARLDPPHPTSDSSGNRMLVHHQVQVERASSHPDSPGTDGSSSTEIVAPDAPGDKQWQHSVRGADRQQFVRKLVRALFPTLDPEAALDDRMQPVVEYARKLEGQTFEKADSSSEYCHLLAEIVCKVQCTRGKLPEAQESTAAPSTTIGKS